MEPKPAVPVSLDAILEDLETLVTIESPSLDLVALKQSAEAVAEILRRRLGGEPTLVDTERGPVVRWSGGGEPVVLLLGHHDTVFPHGTLERRPFAVADDRVTGPGVFDMLGGLIQGIHGVASLPDRSGVEIMVTADEEVGSYASRDLLTQRARACGAVLVLEGSADGGALKVARKGCGGFTVRVHGRASHAGLEPEAGVNALVEAAHQVLAIAALADEQAGTTVTPTVASAGTAANVVPAEAVITTDVRVTSVAEKARVEAAFAALTPVTPGATLTVEGDVNRPPMGPEMSAELFDVAKKIMPSVTSASVGGGSDGNFTAAAGVPTLDGLGAVGGGAHADHEYVIASTMVERAELVAGIVSHLRTT